MLAEQAHGATGTQSDALRDALGLKCLELQLSEHRYCCAIFAWIQTQSADWEPGIVLGA